MRFIIVLLSIMIFSLSGCATQGKKEINTQLEQLQVRVQELEQQLQDRDAEINYLTSELERTESSKVSSKKSSAANVAKPTTKNIQKALKNAGFYKGSIDGHIGKKTRQAIRDFQKAKGLSVDGVVGKKTWQKLSEYL